MAAVRAATASVDRQCSTCVWWDDSEGLGFGLCRVSPPFPDGQAEVVTEQHDDDDDPDVLGMVTVNMGPPSWRGRWPVTAGDDWCGAYRGGTT